MTPAPKPKSFVEKVGDANTWKVLAWAAPLVALLTAGGMTVSEMPKVVVGVIRSASQLPEILEDGLADVRRSIDQGFRQMNDNMWIIRRADCERARREVERIELERAARQ